MRDNGQIRKLAAYVIPAVSMTGHKEVLSIHIGENESAKYWLGVLNELKNRGVKDIPVICADRASALYRSSGKKYVSEKNKKELANDLKTIYHVPSEDAALEALDRVAENGRTIIQTLWRAGTRTGT